MTLSPFQGLSLMPFPIAKGSNTVSASLNIMSKTGSSTYVRAFVYVCMYVCMYMCMYALSMSISGQLVHV